MSRRVPISKTDDLDILSGIWIMSCNDENPIMTYKSVSQRLNLPETRHIKAIVRSRPELFRPGILNSRLNAWKELMKTGKARPNWIIEIADPTLQHKAIDALTRDDIFRNQFRVQSGAARCDITIIDWGLQHIDRLRKAGAEERDARSRKWNQIIIPVASLLVALASVIGTGLLQWRSASQQEATKLYEIEFTPKQRGYSSFMHEMMLAAFAANAKDDNQTLDHLNQMESAYYIFEPFLDEKMRTAAFEKYKQFAELCTKFVSADHASQDYKDLLGQMVSIRTYFRVELFADLFTRK